MATHVTTSRVPALPKPLHTCQVAMFVKQQLRDQVEGSRTQGTMKKSRVWGLRDRCAICDFYHLDLDEVT